MFARSTTYQAQPASIDAGIEFVRDEVMPVASATEGFVGLSFIVDRDSGRCIATTAWHTKEDMRASQETLASLRERGGDVLGGRPQIEEWEIAALHREHRAPDGACMRVSWVRTPPANVDDAIADYSTRSLPALEGLPGFCSASLLVDRDLGRAVVSVMYDSRDSLVRTREAAAMIRTAAEAGGVEFLDVAEFEIAMAHLRVPETV